MSDSSRRSPSPSNFGYSLGRRRFLQGAAGVAGAAALGLSLPSSRAGAQVVPGSASGDMVIGSYHSDEAPKAGLQAMVDAFPNKNIAVTVNITDHNTFQENISTYLQNPDDMLTWFSGLRMRFFAEQGLFGAVDDVWEAGLNDTTPSGFKVASTGDDGKLYLVPHSYYAWGVHYRKSLFEENSWTVPTNLDELMTVATAMQEKGIIPFAFANDGRWPAMGTFDQINFRTNGYQFHVDLMAGKESWTDERVKNVFTTWETLLPFQQETPNGRTWQEAAQAVVSKEAGMMTIGNFIAQQFTPEEVGDLDFFPFPALNDEFGIETVEAPIDGYAMAAEPKNEAAAKEFLNFLGTAEGQTAYLSADPTVVATNSGVDPAAYNALQTKALETVSSAKYVTQFLDRDTLPEFAVNVAGPAFADFIADPSKIDSILEDMQNQAGAIFAE